MIFFKKTRLLLSLLIIWLLTTPVVHAQLSADTLKVVHIKDQHPRDTSNDQKAQFTAGQSQIAIQKAYLDLYASQSLANLLAQQSSVFVKSYGINSMATLSLRGASAAQSSVLWDGVPILNPALGVADLSLLKTGLFSDVKLQYGSSAALYGSGNVGGALMLGDDAVHFSNSKSIEASIGAGSYGIKNGSFSLGWSNARMQIGLHAFAQEAKNNIPYTDANGVAQKLDNAALSGSGALLSVDYNLHNKHQNALANRLYLKAWVQQFDREIPPALFEQYSVRKQRDASIRTLAGWEEVRKRSTFYIKSSYSREYLHYQDSSITQDSKNTVQQFYSEAGWKYRLDNVHRERAWAPRAEHNLLIFAPLQYAAATGQNIDTQKSQFRPAVAATYSYISKEQKLQANVAIRQEWVNGNAAPVLPGAGASYMALSTIKNDNIFKLQVRGNIQRTYRIPTLNELYYFPGGNPDLKPEQGWSQDAGYTFTYQREERPKNEKDISHTKFTFSHELNAFSRNIQDWIYWLGGAIWTPHNIAKVHSRGLETVNKMEYRIGQIKLHLDLNYTYVLSTTEASYLPGDNSIGKQIPYTPRYNVQGNVGFDWLNKIFVNLNQTYTGYRFVTVDESQSLAPYKTTNIQASYHFNSGSKTFQLAGQIQNLLNADYEVVNARPMPGRNFLLQLKVGFWR